MTSYGDPSAGNGYDDEYHRPSYSPQPASSGRASVPSDGYGYEYSDDEPADSGYGSYPNSGAPSPQGYAGQPGYPNSPAPYGPPPTAGRASVPAAAGRATVGGVGAASGRATVGGVSGRASVRPGGPTGFDESGRPVGGPPKDPRAKTGKKGKFGKRKLRTIILASVAVFILLAGGGMIAGTYFYDKVLEPSELALKSNTEIFSADEKQIAKLGKENRIIVPMGTLSEEIKRVLIVGEDKNFFNHRGIDLWGIARAAWNNLTGGETQGASTITQQYARAAANDMEITYARKLREAVMARKLEDKYSKDQILGFYVNTVYYGRSANGVGAAAQAYFKKGADKLTIEEAAVLGAVLKQPEPVKDGPQGFDPKYNKDAAVERWNYVLNNMVENGWLDKTRRDAMVYPEKSLQDYKPGQFAGEWGYQNSGTGNVINYVGDELRSWGIDDWRSNGYRITTTIDSRAQAALEKNIRRDLPGSKMAGQPKNLMAAAVAINPENGRVIAYYGGMSGADIDYAGINNQGTAFESGGHPGASSFKIYTLAAALEAGISIESHWDSTALKKKDGAEFDVQNSGRDNDDSCGKYCTLEKMTILSYNVPFFKIAKEIGPEKVVDMARRAGINTMWSTNDGKAQHLNQAGAKVGRESFYYQVGFGQYPVTVLDHASGVATFAAHGVHRKPHFVVKVEEKDKKTGKWVRRANTGEKVVSSVAMTPAIADEVTGVLKQIVGRHALDGGRQAAAKTGTWENGQMKPDGKTKKYPGENAHAWFVGYTPQIAAAVWVGNVKDELPIRDKNKQKIGGSKLPGDIWEGFMNDAHKAMKLKEMQLPDGTGGDVGERTRGDGKSPTPAAPPVPTDGCFLGLPGCPTATPTGGGGGNGHGWPTGLPSPTRTKTPKPPGIGG